MNPAEPDWLSHAHAEGVERFMRSRGWLAAGERVMGCTPAGAGNMNVTIRVKTDRRQVILKQSRPWVVKYPDIPAPHDRAISEARFYQRVKDIPLVAASMPCLLASDEDACVLVLEDLAETTDLSVIYNGSMIAGAQVLQLATFLGELHDSTFHTCNASLGNRKMRSLNHAHVYVVPFDQPDTNRLDALESGLGDAAKELAKDQAYRSRVAETGIRYLEDGPCLVHGDFFPGSWLSGNERIWIIDAEFSFFGDAEFDVGCAIAHLALANQSRESASNFLKVYKASRRHGEYDDGLMSRYAAAEVARRLIGVAQLPIAPSESWRRDLLSRARDVMLEESWEGLWI